ncbi:hypothetical protein SKAU_G00041460 [Synaphobranchus kaupii]|uniref:Death domain-containing protein CRADD n=1 Tax=Synaphobranchus kaupii TaxID=118154 RepID=A0A9Q1G203_SYNKA|nr:hypothetical protein SKAU_G00041460 [Synaphobranchus kaupii]
MDPRHKELLRKHRLDLSNEILIDDTVVHYLYQENILTESQVEEIQAQATNKKRTLKLLDILPTRGPHAFGAFLKSLEVEFLWVAERLQQDLALLDGASQEQDLTEVCRISEETLRKVPSDQELNRLSRLLGPDWESVLLDLGVSAGQLFRCRANHPHSLQSQVLASLILWRQSTGRRATVHRLLQSLRVAQFHPSTLEEYYFRFLLFAGNTVNSSLNSADPHQHPPLPPFPDISTARENGPLRNVLRITRRFLGRALEEKAFPGTLVTAQRQRANTVGSCAPHPTQRPLPLLYTVTRAKLQY